jgi:hypothetical protein
MDFEIPKSLDNKTPKSRYAISRFNRIVKESRMKLDRRPHRSFGDRDFNMQRTQCNENPDFAICEITIESRPSDQHVI